MPPLPSDAGVPTTPFARSTVASDSATSPPTRSTATPLPTAGVFDVATVTCGAMSNPTTASTGMLKF
jgi:hypothetical protein